MLRILALWLALTGAALAQVPMTGGGLGVPTAAPSFQGLLDVFSTGAYAGYSCARAPNAAFGTGNLCDIVDTATGTFSCTIKAAATGFADLTSLSCTGGTLSVTTFCTVTHAAGCSVTKAYDLTGNGRDVVQATLVSMPILTLSSTPTTTLPAITCSGTKVIQTSGTFTQAQPLTLSGVVIVTTGNVTGGAIGAPAAPPYMGTAAIGANKLLVSGGANLSATATDNAWHSVNGMVNGNGTASAINIDGSDATGAASTSGLSGVAIRLCRAAGNEFIGSIAEAYILASTTTSTNRNNMSTNQHGTNGYNF